MEKRSFNEVVLEKDFITAPGYLLKPKCKDNSERSLYFETSLESFNLFTRMPFVNEKHESTKNYQVHAFRQLDDIAKDIFLISKTADRDDPEIS